MISNPSTIESGSWTPVLGSTSETGQVYAIQTGKYVKIGKNVVCNFAVSFTNKGSITGANILLKGLPFTQASSIYESGAIGFFNNMNSNINYMGLYINASQGFLTGSVTPGLGLASGLAPSLLTNTSFIMGFFMYTTP